MPLLNRLKEHLNFILILKMNKKIKNIFLIIFYFNFIVGILYTLFRYFLKKNTLYGEVSYSVQPFFQYTHIIGVCFFVFILGLIFESHVLKKIKRESSKKKKTGYVLVIFSFLMIFSGYLLQTPFISSYILGPSHTIISTLWSLVLILHLRK